MSNHRDVEHAAFQSTTRVVSGLGSVQLLAREMSMLGVSRPAVIVDRGVAEAGILDRVINGLDTAETIFVDANPGVDDTESAVESARAAGCDSVIAIGGGSGLGLAKAVAIRATNPGSILDYEGTGRAASPPVPVVAIPTTAGSGSEVSNALVLHEAGREREVIVRGPGYEPRVALLDGELLRELPREPMLFAALDALTHAFEALWARRRSIVTDALAEKAAGTIIAHLSPALDGRADSDLQALLEASTAANLACGNTGLGLVHALSSAPAVTLPHGYQNGALLLGVAQFNSERMGSQHLALLDLVPALFDLVGWPGGFAAGDLTRDDLEAMVVASTDHVFRANNVRPSTDDDVRRIIGHASGLL